MKKKPDNQPESSKSSKVDAVSDTPPEQSESYADTTTDARPGFTDTLKTVREVALAKKHNRRRRIVLDVVSIALVVLFSAASIAVLAAFNKVDELAVEMDGEETEAGELPEEVKTLPEWRGKGILNILVCGIDYDDPENNGYSSVDKIGNTDLILYIHWNTKTNQMNILQLPRDIYVGEGVNTGYTGKINGLYYNSDDPDNRMAALATVLKDQFRLPVDYYITIDMDAVREIIDIKGSIPVYVPVDVDDPVTKLAPGESMPVLEAGWRHFSGEEAEYFLRNRYSTTYNGQGDIARLEMQQQFYSALYREFRSLAASDLWMWMDVLCYRVKTDMSANDMLALAVNALTIRGYNINFIRPSAGGGMYYNYAVLSLLPDEFAGLLNEYFRPEGEEYSAEELNIQTLPILDEVGVYEASIRSMSDIQAAEPEYPS